MWLENAFTSSVSTAAKDLTETEGFKLLLLATGLSGAWMSRLMILEPYYPLLALLSLTLIAAGGWQLMQPKSCTKDRGEMISALPEFRTSAVFISALALTLILLSSEYWILWIAG